MKELARDGGIPLYQQLADHIKEQIESGELKENEQLMTEMELGREYNISRITVRKALELLVDEEILTKRQGIGTFISGKKLVRSMNVVMGFTQNCEMNGQKASTKLLSAGLVEAAPTDIKQFGLKEGDQVISICRLRFCDGISVMIEDTRFRKSYAYLLGEDLTGSLHKILDEQGIKLVRGVKRIGICYATGQESELLEVKENSALLLIRDVSYDQNGEVVYVSKSVVNADRYSCTLTID